MTVAALLNWPTGDNPDYNLWSFANSGDHIEITEAVLLQLNIRLNRYIVDPFPTSAMKNWFRAHQNLHDDMNSALGLQGSNLLDLDLQDQTEVQYWVQQHYQEHLAARSALRI
jgi:hypothetical protein